MTNVGVPPVVDGTIHTTTSAGIRIRIFVDFWNFTLGLKAQNSAFRADWSKIGPLFAQKACDRISPGSTAIYEAMHVYGSFDESKDAGLRNWFTNFLDKQAGVHVEVVPRQKKRNPPKCPSCHEPVSTCPECGSDMRGTEEKGVDTRIVTDMIKLAWANAYDAAILVTADRDFVPVAEFLQTKGIKVIHGAFPPGGSILSQKCWGHIDIPNFMSEFSR
ncbi:NYN domain-containing protein (plasmid) [Novacetimonas hansenii]|uniref:NYN domain-containing protein n=1 Tax=Novacetimonas hansenii TaxID=436 RepID=UPI00177C9FED|nr:NYN domain-containing protein [Novacetimonas hansenii]QOF96887.1 NYN domain-containing protein [Novacetimonas hansenii]